MAQWRTVRLRLSTSGLCLERVPAWKCEQFVAKEMKIKIRFMRYDIQRTYFSKKARISERFCVSNMATVLMHHFESRTRELTQYTVIATLIHTLKVAISMGRRLSRMGSFVILLSLSK
jgi:hypothetical protein